MERREFPGDEFVTVGSAVQAPKSSSEARLPPRFGEVEQPQKGPCLLRRGTMADPQRGQDRAVGSGADGVSGAPSVPIPAARLQWAPPSLVRISESGAAASSRSSRSRFQSSTLLLLASSRACGLTGVVGSP